MLLKLNVVYFIKRWPLNNWTWLMVHWTKKKNFQFFLAKFTKKLDCNDGDFGDYIIQSLHTLKPHRKISWLSTLYRNCHGHSSFELGNCTLPTISTFIVPVLTASKALLSTVQMDCRINFLSPFSLMTITYIKMMLLIFINNLQCGIIV